MRGINYRWGPRLASWARKRWVIFKNPHAEIKFGKYCLLGKDFSLHMPEGGRFIAGKAVDFRRGFRAEIARGASVVIGDLCVFSYYSLIQCSTSIEIGNTAMFGQSSIIVDGNHRFKDVSTPLLGQGFDFRPVKIADHVTTLTKVTILADIGTKSVVAANSVVNRPVPPYTMAGGVPARTIDYFGPPELEPPEWTERRRQKGDVEPAPRSGVLEVSGHSLAFGGGVSAFGNRLATRLAELCDADEVNRAVPGAIACWHESGADPGDGGYAHVLNAFSRTADLAAQHPAGLAGLTWYGVNDLALLGPDGLGPFEHALRAVLSRHRASAVFEETHESVVPSAAWSPRSSDGPDCSGAGGLETQDDGATLTVNVDAGFPGGTVALGFLASPGQGALHVFTVDGEPAGTLDTRGITASEERRNGAVMRLTGLQPAAHTIECRVAEPAGSTVFDYWQVEREPAPPVIVPLAYEIPEPGHHYETWPHLPVAEGIEALNEATRRVAAEFDDRVVLVDTEAVLGGRRALFSWEGLYPNDDGHAALAAACRDALAQALPAATQKMGVST